jgi:hypothetical protein
MKIGNQISRRFFLAVTGGAALVLGPAWPTGNVPSLLDHVLLGCDDLYRGIDFVELHTGVRAAFGGVHPGRGTRNALLSLGERRYLEIIAPDPKQDRIEPFAQKQVSQLKQLTSPHLIGWAAHPGDLEQFSAHLREAGIGFDGPRPGSRQRPDGKLLQWKTLNLKDDNDGLLPLLKEAGKRTQLGSAVGLVPTVAGDCTRFRMTGRPVFRRKRHAPEAWPRRRKLQSNLCLACAYRTEECHVALLLLFGTLVLQKYLAPAREPRFHKHQRTVRIDSQRFGLFLDVLALNILAANSHGHLHYDPLAAAARYARRHIWGLTHPNLTYSTITSHAALSSRLRGCVSKEVNASWES